MEVFHLVSSDETPEVILDSAKGNFEISGRSLPEDAVSFFNPIMDWLKAYGASPNPTTSFVFRLDYFNTASSKLILDLLNVLKEIKGIQIVWYSYADDEEVQDAGTEFSEQVEIPFEFRTR